LTNILYFGRKFVLIYILFISFKGRKHEIKGQK
jgi:hypothetical protein